jgi:hypothetical protein
MGVQLPVGQKAVVSLIETVIWLAFLNRIWQL